MLFKFNLFFTCFFLFGQIGYAQLLFTDLPSDLQMIPRSDDNLGHFKVSGKSMNLDIESVRLVIRQNSDSTLIYDEKVEFDDGSAAFTVNLSIPSVLNDFDLEIYTNHPNNIQQLYKRVKQLVAGDYFIVTGQSNAFGAIGAYEASVIEDSLYGNKYCRTIGNISGLAHSEDSINGIEKDLTYLLPTSLYWASATSGCIGVWPLRVMNAVVKNVGIPVCIINGAVGATELSYHFASHTPTDPTKLRDTLNSPTFFPYDRIYRKLYNHNAISGVKGVFWYQGESDAVLSREEAQTYNKRFALLRESWKRDYPNVGKIFVFQINAACGGDYVSLIRDQQRKLSKEFSDVIVLPTVGSTDDDRAKDGCHYTDQGYGKLGENMAPLLLKHLYHFDFEDKYIMGPSIERIYYSKKNEICLEFDMDVIAQESKHYNSQNNSQNEGTVYLLDYFFDEATLPINPSKMRTEDNKIYLTTSGTRPTKLLTYLPDVFSNIPTTYTGPWILNKNNEQLGALSFFEFPVEPYPNELWFTENEFLITYPNPVTDYLVIRKIKTTQVNTLSLYDSYGKKVLEIPRSWEEYTTVDLRIFENGLYYLKASTNEGVFVQKIILNNNVEK